MHVNGRAKQAGGKCMPAGLRTGPGARFSLRRPPVVAKKALPLHVCAAQGTAVPSAACRSGNEVRPLPSGTSDRCFLVHNVDIISDLDLRWFVAQSRPDALATLLVSERKTSRYLLFDKGMRLAGWTNVTTGEVRSPYPDLDVQSCRRLAFSGIHFISDRIFSVMDEEDSLF